MGRYVSGDFEYKFAFGEQSSNLGEILEEIADETYEDDVLYVNRFTNQSGEICRVDIYDVEKFENYVKEVYLKDFKDKTDEEWDKWSKGKKFGENWHNQNMMKLFIENLKETNKTYLELEIEY